MVPTRLLSLFFLAREIRLVARPGRSEHLSILYSHWCPVLSISFLPWILLLLGIVISIPVVGMMESKKRKKEMAAAQAEYDAQQRAREVADDDGMMQEEMPVAASDGGFGDFGSSDPQMAGFDDDAFK